MLMYKKFTFKSCNEFDISENSIIFDIFLIFKDITINLSFYCMKHLKFIN